MADEKRPVGAKPTNDVAGQVAGRVRGGDNVLIALSRDPSVDELSAAIGLTFLLDKMGKHATAIFSGAVPNAIEFLEPEKTFETNTNSLQDFIIALDKNKADHLRYKIDGDYVKVYITPYKTTIDEGDLEFSHGDFNVDLVIALGVGSAEDLDGALAEHGRIMHDASAINIGIEAPGKFGDLQWSDPAASSVSEMIYGLAGRLKDQEELVDKSVATALLAGIVAATSRFSNERTTPATMTVASQLMAAGADQQLISSSIPVDGVGMVDEDTGLLAVDSDEAMVGAEEVGATEPVAVGPVDPSRLEVKRDEPGEMRDAVVPEAVPVGAMPVAAGAVPVATPVAEAVPVTAAAPVAEVSKIEMPGAGSVTEGPKVGAVSMGEPKVETVPTEGRSIAKESEETPEEELDKVVRAPMGAVDMGMPGPLMNELREVAEHREAGELDGGKVLEPEHEKVLEPLEQNEQAPQKDYASMMAQELDGGTAGAGNGATPAASGAESADSAKVGDVNSVKSETESAVVVRPEAESAAATNEQNVAAQAAPEVPSKVEINGIPAIDYGKATDMGEPMSAPSIDTGVEVVQGKQVVSDPVGEATDESTIVTPEPVAPAEKTPAADPVPAATSLPMPDVNAEFLPPPPPPFDPDASQTSAADFSLTPPPVMPEAVSEVTGIAASGATAVAPGAMMAAPAVVEPIAPAAPEPEPEGERSFLGNNPVMTDQVYPREDKDPGAFRLPTPSA